MHFSKLTSTDLSAYTFEKRKTNHPQAKSDIDIFDGSGALVIVGREFGGNQIALWLPQETTSPA
jgi:hypothetical protein